MDGRESLEPFAEWGGPTWQRQLGRGLKWLGDVSGMRVLEIGTRHGRMATWFALQGATVVGLDLDEAPLVEARRFAAEHGVAGRTTFEAFSGDPAEVPVGFDVVFAKSVVVLMDIEAALRGFWSALNVDGRLLVVENARGPLPLHVLRMIRRRSLRPHGARYFDAQTVRAVSRHFAIGLEHWTTVPPTVVLGGTRRRTVRLTDDSPGSQASPP